jgi:hypothetical protein
MCSDDAVLNENYYRMLFPFFLALFFFLLAFSSRCLWKKISLDSPSRFVVGYRKSNANRTRIFIYREREREMILFKGNERRRGSETSSRTKRSD